MYGDRINQLDLRVAKTVSYRRSRTRLGARHLQRAELERGAGLQQHVRPGRTWLQPTDDPVAAVSQALRRDRLLIRACDLRRASCRTMAVGLALLALADSRAARRRLGPPRKQMLVLYSTQARCAARDRRVTASCRESSRAACGTASTTTRSSSTPGGFPTRPISAAFRDFLRSEVPRPPVRPRHRDGRTTSVEFFDQQGEALSPETPLVFFTRPLRCLAARRTRPGSSAELNLGGTLALAMQLDPEARHVFVVTGTAEGDKKYEALAREQLRSLHLAAGGHVSRGSGRRKTSKRACATLPPHSFVYYLLVGRDGAGENFNPLDYLDRHCRRSRTRRPTAGWTPRWAAASSAAA